MTLLPPSPAASAAHPAPPQPHAFANSPVVPTATNAPQAASAFDIWGPLQRRKYLIALFGFVGALLGYLHYANSPKVYSSSVRLMITTNAPPSLIDGDLRLTKEPMAKHASLISSELVLAEASNRGKFEQLDIFKDTSYPVAQLQGMVRVVAGSDETLSIVCTGSNPDDLPAILSQIVQTYESKIKEDSQAVGQNAIELIQRLEARLNLEKDGAYLERDQLVQKLQIQAIDDEGYAINPHNRPLALLQQQVEELQIQLSDVSDRNRLLLENIAIDPKTGKIDAMKIGIAAIEARDYLNLAQKPFNDEIRGGTLRNLAPEMAERKSIQGKIWNLDEQLERLKFQRSEYSTKYGSGHSKISTLDNQIRYYSVQRANLQKKHSRLTLKIEGNQTITDSEQKQAKAGRMDLKTFRANEEIEWVKKYRLRLHQDKEHLTSKIERLNERITTVSNKANGAAADIVRLNRLQNEIKEKADAVAAITDKLSQMNILNDTYSMTTVRTLNPARRGAKVAPTMAKSLALGTMLALIVGFGLAILVDQSELAYRSPAEIFEKLQVPVVGKIPRINTREIEAKKGHASLVAAHKPAATASESFRDVRTALFFRANMDDIKTILFTSPSPGDGKSTTVANLAISIAQAGKKVILVDADFRRPRVHKYFGEDLNPGLMDVLKGELSLKDAVQKADLQEGLFLLPAGGRPVNPGELVTSEAFRDLVDALREEFDYVLIDSPPVLPVSDPATIASIVDGVYMVTRIRKGVKLTSQKAKETLDRVGANWMGIIVNGLDENPHYSEYGYQYGSYSYYGGMYGRYYDANNRGYRDKINAN